MHDGTNPSDPCSYLDAVAKCPACGSAGIRINDPCEREPDMTECDCRCRACGFEWQDVFETVPYFIGRQIDGELIQTPQQIMEQAARENAGELVTAASAALADMQDLHPDWDTLVRLRAIIDKIEKGASKNGQSSQE